MAYAVASEAVLYPNSELSWKLLYYLPRKAYWHIYGELFLEDIEGIFFTSDIYFWNSEKINTTHILQTMAGIILIQFLKVSKLLRILITIGLCTHSQPSPPSQSGTKKPKKCLFAFFYIYVL